MKKKNLLLLIFVLIIFALASCFVLEKIKSSQESQIVSLKAKIVPMQFTMTQDGNSIVVDYEFLDLREDVVASDTVRLRGNELFIDCVVKNYNSDIKVAFPVILYTNVIPSAQGTVIAQVYNNDSFPNIFRGVKDNEKKKLRSLYSEVLKEVSDKNAFRSSPHILAEKDPKKYQLVSRIRGGLEIISIKGN